jgi:hypothetical protein
MGSGRAGGAGRRRPLGEAIELLAPISAVGARPDYPRSALLHGSFLAKAYILRGDLDLAVDATRAALTRLGEVQSVRGRNYLRHLRAAFARRTRSAGLAELLPDFDRALSKA